MLRDDWRRTALPALRGDVLDLGAGYGGALPHLDGARSVTCVEPRPSRRLREQARTHGAQLDAAAAEQLPYPADSFDAAICSAVLCSVSDPRAALAELRRVLRPRGTVVFFEHVGSAPGTWSRRVQRAIAPISRLLDSGCDPARDTLTALQAAFVVDVLDKRATVGILGFETVLISGRATAESRLD